MQKRWNILDPHTEKAAALRASLNNISPVICSILVQRGIDSFDTAKDFFRPQLSHLHSPWLMKDMDKAVARILLARDRKERIMVYGDYDVDGTAAVACMYQFLCNIHGPQYIDFYIPHRYKEGYGVSQKGIEAAKASGATLMISLDCGIKSVDLIQYAKQLGIDFIVCDHHLPDPQLPPAVAILNPRQADCPYPYKELCGCGVGFKLITALSMEIGLMEESYMKYLDLVATAIAADIVPVTGENRVLAYYGLKQVNEKPSIGIRALIKADQLEKQKGEKPKEDVYERESGQRPMNINSLIFMIAPRVNAAGRMDDARKAVLLFVEKDEAKAMEYARILHSDNSERKVTDLNITEEALALIQEMEEPRGRKSTVVFNPNWHKGVVGIVASRLIDSYYRPTIVLTMSGEIVAGSARSVSGFNLYEAIHACREHLLGYGGHFAAAGMTMLPEQVDKFIRKFEEVVAATIEPHLLIPEIRIDAEVRFSDLDTKFYNILMQMEPFGPDNARPVFVARGVQNTGSRIVKAVSRNMREDHIKFVLKQDAATFNGIGFGMASRFHLLEQKKPIDIVFTLDENEWNNEKHLQLKVLDFRITEESY
ncbi:MAG: single-stranded-DNA-specific exonuclease RecJ [Bacteroidetes bacterium]|nr:single-stranded-DNA-specific exonuclease RecJ [Bacteroidota bacterium]